MKNAVLVFAVILAVIILLAAYSHFSGAAASRHAVKPAEKLRLDMIEIVKDIESGGSKADGIIAGFVIDKPEPFFIEIFGSKAGMQLAVEYELQKPALKSRIKDLIREAVSRGRTNVRIRSVARASRNITTEEAAVFKIMREPAALHTAILEKPGEKKISALWYFVEQDGAYKLAGRMVPPSAN